MKKYLLLIASSALLSINLSCSESELILEPPYNDQISSINTESKLQSFLNGAYLSFSSSNAFGAEVLMFGDLLSDNMFVSNSNSSYLTTYNMNYTATQNEFNFYNALYDTIMNCNLVINNTSVAENNNVKRIKSEAKILRAFCYFTLVNYYSPTPSSGLNQEYGVPLVLNDYDATIQPARASVSQVYSQIISDLQDGLNNAVDTPSSKVILSKTAAKLLLSKVYLTRRASGDAALALQNSSDIVNNAGQGIFASVISSNYNNYFASIDNTLSENQPETIWELDMNFNSNNVTGVGSNLSLPAYYNRTDGRKSFLFTQSFYDSFPHTSSTISSDVRRGAGSNGLLTTTGAPSSDNPKGVWTNKYPRYTQEGNYFRNIKILRFADAQLSRIEALYLTGQTTLALQELNDFATSRGGSTYTGTNLLNDILTERAKEFYGEGQRFLDLKRYSLPIVRTSNSSVVSNVPANDKLFVLPIGQTALNQNPNLKQYPGYN